MAGKSFWTDFYRTDHPSQALKITTLIMQSFDRDARLAGKTPIVVIFPWGADLRGYQKNRTWVYQPLIDNLIASGIDVINVGDALAAYLEQRSPSDVYTASTASHLNREGNEVAAKLIAGRLKGND